MMKKTIASLASAALVLSNVVVVAAADNATVVTNTGSNATVNSSANNTTVVNVTNVNNATVAQTDVSNNTTGGNTESGNISLCCSTGAGIVTGNAGSVSNMNTDVNSNTTAVVLPSNGGANNYGDVANTGANFTGNLSANSTTVVGVTNSNNLTVAQTNVANNNTGDNTSNANIGNNGILTGDAVSVSNMNVEGNQNHTAVLGLDGNPCGTCTGNNNLVTNTGSNFNLNSSTNQTDVLTVFNQNNMFVAQTVFANNLTGGNTSTSNIGSGVIGTGNAASLANFNVEGNANETGVGLNLPMGSNLADVLNTGVSATLNLSANNTTVATALNANNYFGAQTSLVSNTSGLNASNSNVGAFGTFTGHAGAGSNFMAGGNNNSTYLGGALGLLAWLAWL